MFGPCIGYAEQGRWEEFKSDTHRQRGAKGAEFVERRKREGPSAVGARIEEPKAPKGIGCGEGVLPSTG